jgi:4-alpha-glucanotransferase
VSATPERRETPRPSTELATLAEAWGVVTSYEGVDGAEHEASPETLVAVLGALGAPIDSPGGATEALRSQAATEWRALEPVLVHDVRHPKDLVIELPAHVHPSDGWQVLELEDGSVQRERLSSAIARPIGTLTRDGRRLSTYQLRLGASTPDLPTGYHRLRFEAPGVEAESLLMVAPRCPQPTRGWGAFLPLHALRTDADAGVGRYGDLAALARWVKGLGGQLVGTLPLYPAHLHEPVDPSPYLPVTKLAWNELYVDPTSLPELEIAPAAVALLESDDIRRAMTAARQSVLVDYPAVMATTRSVLTALAEALFEHGGARRQALEDWVGAHLEIAPYARFRAADEVAGAGETSWRSAGTREVPSELVDTAAERYYLYAQWVAATQLAATGVAQGTAGLYLDMPIGVHPSGFDPWWEPESFAASVRGGAPPDSFFEAGQDWGFPPLHPIGIRSSEYRYVIAMLRHAFSRADALRIDHVMGLHRLYWIPGELDARHGAYVRYRDEELRAVVAIEAARKGAAVIGEDLGTVDEAVRADMTADGMLRSWVFQFEASAEDPLPAEPERAMASFGTHDLPRFAAFWNGLDIDERASRGLVDAEDAAREHEGRTALRTALLESLAHRQADGDGAPEAAPPAAAPSEELGVLCACLEHMAEGDARLMLVDLEDLWGERRPQNRPGTGAEASNWRRRSEKSLAEIESDPFVAEVLGAVGERRRRHASHQPRLVFGKVPGVRRPGAGEAQR